jgi:hypothetical protein
MALTTHSLLVPRLSMDRSLHLPPLSVCLVCYGTVHICDPGTVFIFSLKFHVLCNTSMPIEIATYFIHHTAAEEYFTVLYVKKIYQ